MYVQRVKIPLHRSAPVQRKKVVRYCEISCGVPEYRQPQPETIREPEVASVGCDIKAKPLISLPVDAVINEEGELERMDHWANKMWKLGGSRHMKIDDKLRFLYEHGRKEQVGMYLRNQNLRDKTFPDSCKLRKEFEK